MTFQKLHKLPAAARVGTSVAGWGLDNEVLGGSRVLPAYYPRRPSLAVRLAEAWRMLRRLAD
jgi:hypothetical protein